MPGLGWLEARDCAKQCGLARPIGATQHQGFACPQAKGDTFENRNSTSGDAQIFDR